MEHLQKVHLACIANTFAHWTRLHSAAHSGTSRLGECTEKLLKVWSNVTCIQSLRLWYEHTIEQSMLRLSSTLLVDRSTNNTQALAWDLWRWEVQRRRVAKKLSLGWSNWTYIQALRLWNEHVQHASLQRKLIGEGRTPAWQKFNRVLMARETIVIALKKLCEVLFLEDSLPHFSLIAGH